MKRPLTLLFVLLSLYLPASDLTLIVGKEPTFSQPVSQLATHAQFLDPDFALWAKEIKATFTYHRKLWEFCYVIQTLHKENLLEPGKKGLAFGVGLEPLPALFAKFGCEILATDQDLVSARNSGWVHTTQYAKTKAALNDRKICNEESFNRLVELRNVDMRHIPADLHGQFDFVWSCCSYEHLGSLRAGMEFVKNSIQCLKPGGIAVHTTEFNLTSNTDTLTSGPTVIYRRCDMIELAIELLLLGYEVYPINFHRGNYPLDNHIDCPPYQNNPHIKLQIGKYQATSIGIIVKKPL